MKKFDNDKVTSHRCSVCHRPIRVPESVARGKGPICYGKVEAIKKLLRQGKTREEILETDEEVINKLARGELKRWRDEHKKDKKIKKSKVRKIRTKKVKSKKDKNQRTLESWLKNIPEVRSSFGFKPLNDKEIKIQELKKELNEINYTKKRLNK